MTVMTMKSSSVVERPLSSKTMTDALLGPFTCDELYEDGFRLFVDPAPEEEIVEVTMDEIAGKMGVPVERLRVKKEK